MMQNRSLGYLRVTVMLFWLAGCASPVTRSLGTEEGLASYYSSEFQGKKTSSGETFDKNKLTAAHRSYPFGTIVKVTNMKNGKEVQVRVNDRGPVKPERIIDLSYAAAEEIGLIKLGLVRVKLEVLEWGDEK